eukprot:3396137-Alexandrium_andersonii.AAC.1
MLLVFVGFRRGWWTTFDETPYFLANQGPLVEQENPEPAGLEPAVDEAEEGGAEEAEQTENPPELEAP